MERKKRKQNVWRCRDGKGVRCKGDCSNCDISRFGAGASRSDISLECFIPSDRKKKDCAEELGISPSMFRHREKCIYEKLRAYLKKSGWI